MDSINLNNGLIGLKSIREALALPQDEVAKLCGLTQVHISNLEAGRTLGSITTLRSLCEAMGATADDLLSIPCERRIKELRANYMRRAADRAQADAQEVA